MSQTQLELPALTDEESTVVERFRERSKNIIPGVEVTLAKRILRPGSNRVVCLAARTSVPINDDELASVSDLALRLSDGTNVVLSLSFFNDTVAGDCIPFTRSAESPNRYTYDPNRYTIRSDSKLGIVLFATCLVALAGVYSLTNGPLSKYMVTKPFVKSAFIGASSSLLKTIPVNPNLSAPKPPVVAPMESQPKESTSSVIKVSPRATTGHIRRARERRNPDSWRASNYVREPREEMLVPPPPATYVAPYGLPAQFFEQFPGFNGLPNLVKPGSKGEPKTVRPSSKSEPKPEPKSESKLEPKSLPKAEPKSELKPEAKPALKTEPKAEFKPEAKPALKTEPKAEFKPEAKPELKSEPKSEPRSVSNSSATSTYERTIWEAPKAQIERIPANNSASHATAPIPGTEDTMPLERIVPR